MSPADRSNTIVLANGVFDIYHVGHAMYLQAGANMGDLLIVGVTLDAYVNKGPGRPVNKERDRLDVIKSVRYVDFAFLCKDSLEALESVQPDIFVKGKDYIDKIEKKHEDYCKAHGIEIRFTDTPIYSATKIINDRLRLG